MLLTSTDFARMYIEADLRVKQLEAELKAAKSERADAADLVLHHMESEGIETPMRTQAGTVSVTTLTSYSQTDPAAVRQIIMDSGMSELLSLNAQTLKGFLRDAEEGEQAARSVAQQLQPHIKKFEKKLVKHIKN